MSEDHKEFGSLSERNRGKEHDVSKFKLLENAAAVRAKPHQYLGAKGMDAIFQQLREFIDNNVDLAKAVTYRIYSQISFEADGFCTIVDNGWGIPVEDHPEYGVSGLYLAVEYLNAGTKMGEDSITIGTHGVGMCAAMACCERFEVTVKRGGNIYFAAYEFGERVVDLQIIGNCEVTETGTSIRFKPDTTLLKMEDSYQKYDYPFRRDQIKKTLEDYSMFNKNIEFNVSWDDGKVTEKWHITPEQNSAEALLRNLSPGTVYKFERISEEVGYEAMGFISFADGYSPTLKASSINGLRMISGGLHESALIDSVHKFFVNIFRARKLLKAEADLEKSLVENRLNYVIMIDTTKKEYAAQVKNVYTNIEVGSDLREYFWKFLENLSDEDIESMVQSLNISYQTRLNEIIAARKAAEKKLPRQTYKEVVKEMSKMHHCSNDKSKRRYNSLWLVEGKSAGNTFMNARDAASVAFIEMRGKPANVNKRKNHDQIVRDSTYKLLVQSIKDNKYSKYVIATDGDTDGMHIRNLLLLMFMNYFPELVQAGMVYICLTPLATMSRGSKQMLVYSEEEMANVQKEGWSIVRRYKGLGQMNADELEEVTMINPKFVLVSPESFGPLHSQTERTQEDVIYDLTANKTHFRKQVMRDLIDPSLQNYYDNEGAIKRSIMSKVNPQLTDDRGVPLTQDEIDRWVYQQELEERESDEFDLFAGSEGDFYEDREYSDDYSLEDEEPEYI